MNFAVAISGGVDSAVAAYLTQKSGSQVFGIFMRNWHDDSGQCSYEEDLSMAKAVANQLSIKLHVVDFAEDYKQEVFADFITDYKQGLTPNPDILCNKNIKFKHLWNAAKQLGADKLVTGHYARIVVQDEQYYLAEGLDPKKDQSYFLCALSQEQLKQSHFPLGELAKQHVREIAKSLGLLNHNRKDSTGICFVEPKHFQKFLRKYILDKPGAIIDLSGNKVGQHSGLSFYTIGQRQGLNIGGLKNGNGQPWYVVEKDLASNQLIVCQGGDNPKLYSKKMVISQPNFSDFTNTLVRIRHLGDKTGCEIEQDSGKYIVHFADSVRAVTPGQYAAFYKDDLCLGFARILH